MTEAKKPNWEEAVKRAYYVAWVLWTVWWVIWITRDFDRINTSNMLAGVIWFAIPYFPFVAAKWVYAGYKNSK